MKRITRDTTIDDLLADPKGFGLPTLEEYSKMRETYWGRSDDAMASIVDGPQSFRKDLRKIKFQVHGSDLSSAEQCERVLGDYGYTLEDIDLDNRNSKLKKQIDMIPLGGGKFDILVNFLP